VLLEVPNSVDGSVDAEVRGLWVGHGDVHDDLAATVGLCEQCFTVEEPGIGKFLWRELFRCVGS
jgi:hypothetical protein